MENMENYWLRSTGSSFAMRDIGFFQSILAHLAAILTALFPLNLIF